jgi:hypothetical protein
MEFKLPPRSAKPRAFGTTSVIDFGPDTFGWTGVQGVRDLLDYAADYVDFAKIYAMNALHILTDICKPARHGASIYHLTCIAPPGIARIETILSDTISGSIPSRRMRLYSSGIPSPAVTGMWPINS